MICIVAQYFPSPLTLSNLATGVPRRILWDYPEKAYFHIWWARAWAVDIGFARYWYRRPQGQHWIPQISAFIPSNSGKENFSLHNHFPACISRVLTIFIFETIMFFQWFWRALRSFAQAERAKFLQFVTGTSKVPLQGFAYLEGKKFLIMINLFNTKILEL